MPNDQSLSRAFPSPRRPWSVRTGSAPAPSLVEAEAIPRDTRYTISWLEPNGMIEDRTVAAPSTTLFTEAFAAIVRGGLVMTPDGPCAIEDLLPGDRIITDQGVEKLLWKGGRTIAPNHKNTPLYRIAADSLGPSRPSPDLLLGPAARLVSRRSALRTLIGADSALVPVASLADGETVIQINPMSSVQVFHIGFARHTTFTANGVEIESVHPGSMERSLPLAVERLYMSMFPHLNQPSDFGALALERLQGELLAKVTRVA